MYDIDNGKILVSILCITYNQKDYGFIAYQFIEWGGEINIHTFKKPDYIKTREQYIEYWTNKMKGR